MSNLRKTDESELQTRNGQDHTRSFDPEVYRLLNRIVKQLEKINTQLTLMTDEEV